MLIEFNSDSGVLQIKWVQKPSLEDLKDTYSKVFQMADESYSTAYFCIDMSECGSFSVEQENWLQQEYYPLVHQALHKSIYIAIVFSEEHFKAIISNYKTQKPELFHPHMHFNYFTNAGEAQHWLKSIKKGQDAVLIPNYYS